MPTPKRRAGESLTSYNRRLVAYYANRRTLENGFYDDEEDVDIRDLTAGSPATANTRTLSRRSPDNRFYAEDRRKSSKPSNDRNIWDGYSESSWGVDTGTNRRPRRVAEGGKGIEKGNPVSKKETGPLAEDLAPQSRRPRRVVDGGKDIKKGAKIDNSLASANGYSRSYSEYKYKNTSAPSAEDLAPQSRRPRRVVEGGKGIPEKKRTENAYKDFRDYPNGKPQTRGANGVSQRGSASQSSMSGNFRGISENGRTSTEIGQVRRVGEPIATNRNQASRTKEVRDGTMARMGSSRQVLENGFNEEKKKSQFKGRHN